MVQLRNYLFIIMEFPASEWDAFDSDQFEVASPRGTGEAVMELMMQLRPNGRIQDHFRLALGGNKMCKAKLGFGMILPTVDLQKLEVTFDFWVKDVKIRRNMSTSDWFDVADGIRANNIQLEDRLGTVLSEDDRAAVLVILEKSENFTKSASLRYAIVVGPDNRMWLELQGMPGPAKLLSSKPAFTG